MNLVSIIIIACVALFAVIGLITGLVKGFTRVRSWASELVLSGIITIFAGWLTEKYLPSLPAHFAGAITLAVGVACVILFAVIFALMRKGIKKGTEKRRELSYYRQYDEIEDNTEKILQALDDGDKRSYQKLSKRKFKRSGGGWTVTDKLFGGITLAIKGAVITGLIAAIVLTIIDFTRLASDGGVLNGVLGSLYAGKAWEFFKGYLFDFFVIGILMVCIKSGYSSGISGFVWGLIMLGLVVGSGLLAWFFAFKVDVFINAATALDGKLADKLASVASMLEAVGMTTLTISQLIIAVGIFIVLIIVVILVGIFVPKLIDRAREGAAFRAVDGVLGAIFTTVVVFGILLLLGAVLNSLYEVEFMNVFNVYFGKSTVATYIYNNNVLNSLGVIKFNIGSWLK